MAEFDVTVNDPDMRLAHRYRLEAGWKALTAGAGDGDVSRGRRLIEEAGGVAQALHRAHPDHGGADQDFRDVIAARDAMKAVG